MANPTTNYGFVLPTSTDLVTDLPADFDVALQGVDTTLKALNPSTTLGDIDYASSTANTNTRLGIGSTGQVLTVAGGVPSWATPSGSGASFSLLNAGGTALTGAATVTVSGLSGYDSYLVIIENASASANSIMGVRLNGDTAAKYTHAGGLITSPSSYPATGILDRSNQLVAGTTTMIPVGRQNNAAAGLVLGSVRISGGKSTGFKAFTSTGAGGITGAQDSQQGVFLNGFYDTTSTITSISAFSNTGNFDAGTLFVYGSAV